MAIGIDLIGSKTSMAASKTVELEATPVGIKMYSHGSKRTIVIPYANVKGFELMPEPAVKPEAEAPKKVKKTE